MATEERLLRLENAFTTLAELAGVQSGRLDDSNERLHQVEAHLDVLGQRMTEIAVAHKEIAVAQVQTEQSLNALTVRVDSLSDTVERYIEGRNGTA